MSSADEDRSQGPFGRDGEGPGRGLDMQAGLRRLVAFQL